MDHPTRVKANCAVKVDIRLKEKVCHELWDAYRDNVVVEVRDFDDPFNDHVDLHVGLERELPVVLGALRRKNLVCLPAYLDHGRRHVTADGASPT